MSEWFFPMTLLPGVGLLIMSTSNLSMGLSAEIASLLKDDKDLAPIIRQKISQLSRLNLSLTSFYISCAGLVVSGLIAGVSKESESNQFWSEVILWIAITCIFIALILLMIYSAKAVRIKRSQFKQKLEKW